MRGKANIGDDFRITPAYAGKSRHAAAAHVFREDHPRLCGEKPLIQRVLLCSPGSPPPMRGKGRSRFVLDCDSRITPAYAGKRQNHQPQRFSEQDHPRLCGEKAVQRGDITGMSGSPPPMRGKGLRAFPSTSTYRITPAYAGKSISTTFSRSSFWDHPRLCGEKPISG